MSDLTVSMILRLVDQVTGPIKPVLAGLREVGTAVDGAGRAMIDGSNRAQAAIGAQKQALAGAALETAGWVYAVRNMLQPAIDFEAAMAGVKKVVSFKGETGITVLGNDLLDLSERIPFAADGLAEIVAAAGRAGLIDNALPDDQKRAQLIAFAEAAAKMGTAFDISAGEAGDALAQWQAALGMGQDESLKFADALNYLANNMNTTEKNLIDIVGYVGAVARTAGLTNTEIAALSAAISAAGASPERAATGLKNFTNALTRGASATKRQGEIFKELGFDSEAMAERMQVDAKGAILDVLEALKQLPAARQNAAIGDLFGEEAKGAIAPMLVNLDALRHALDLVAEPGNYDGAMLKEFEAQSGTVKASLQLTLNTLNKISVALGTVFLPAINAALIAVRDFVRPLAAWAQANPALVLHMGQMAALLIGLRIGSIALSYGVLTLVQPILSVVRALGWMLRLAAIANPFGLLIAGMAALAYAVYSRWDAIAAYFAKKIATIRSAFDHGFLDGIRAALRAFNPFGLLYDAMDAIASYATDKITALAVWIDAYLSRFSLYTSGKTMMAGWARGMSEVVGPALSRVGNLIRSGLGLISLGETGADMFRSLKDGALAMLADFGAAVVAYVSDLAAPILSAFDDGIANGIGAVLATLLLLPVDLVVGLAGRIVEALGSFDWSGFAGSVMTGISDLFISGADSGLLAAGGAILAGLAAGAAKVLGPRFEALKQDLIRIFGDISLYDAGVALIQSLWDGAASLIGKMVAFLKDKIAGIMPDWALNLLPDSGEAAGAGAAPDVAIDTRKAQVPGGTTNNTRTTTVNAPITINAAPGMNENTLARSAAGYIERMGSGRDAPLSDPGEDLR